MQGDNREATVTESERVLIEAYADSVVAVGAMITFGVVVGAAAVWTATTEKVIWWGAFSLFVGGVCWWLVRKVIRRDEKLRRAKILKMLQDVRSEGEIAVERAREHEAAAVREAQARSEAAERTIAEEVRAALADADERKWPLEEIASRIRCIPFPMRFREGSVGYGAKIIADVYLVLPLPFDVSVRMGDLCLQLDRGNHPLGHAAPRTPVAVLKPGCNEVAFDVSLADPQAELVRKALENGNRTTTVTGSVTVAVLRSGLEVEKSPPLSLGYLHPW